MKSLTIRYGGWAIVTGATSGIGKSFAEQLARSGMHLVLVARSEDRLQDTANDLQERYGIRSRAMPLDLSLPLSAETLDLETRDLDVGLLINNAAVEQRGSYVCHTPNELKDANALNITTPSELGRRFGRRFVERGRGGILFVSGIIGYQAVPHLASYAAAKAHQLNLAEALYYELRPHGVDVLGLSPGLTKTPMVGRLGHAIRFGRIGMMKLRPDYVAKVGLTKLGRRPSIVVGLQYKVFSILTKRILSRASGAWLFGRLFRFAFADKSLLDPARILTPEQRGALRPEDNLIDRLYKATFRFLWNKC
jgi:short-subunit dehydrogenase